MGLKIGTKAYYAISSPSASWRPPVSTCLRRRKASLPMRTASTPTWCSLASYSFGQTFNISPLQLIRAQAATINGGYLYTPYLVDQILDDEGNIISQHETTAVRQVVSEETSALVRECLEYVVSSGGGRNGQVTGYRIGGKTGTADKTGTNDVVVSLCASPRRMTHSTSCC